MLAKIPDYIKQYLEGQENPQQIKDRLIKFSDIFSESTEEEPVQIKQDRNKLVSETTKRIYASIDEDGKKTAIVLDCIQRQLYIEKQCESQDEFDYQIKNSLLLFEKFGDDLNDNIAIIRDIDEQLHRIYYENGNMSLKELCEYYTKNGRYWFNKEDQLRNIFKQVFLILHKLFENEFYYGNISPSNIVFCKQQYGEPGLVPKLLDIGYGSFDFQAIPDHYSNQVTIEVETEEDRRILELQVLGRIFETIMFDSIVEYETNQLQFLKDIAQKPENFQNEVDPYQIPEEKIKKLRQYYSKEIYQTLDAIRNGVDYNEILGKVIGIDIDEEDINYKIFDEDTIYYQVIQQKVMDIEKDIKNKDELLAYLQIIKSLEFWEFGVKVLKQFEEKFPFKENLNLIYESLYIHRMAGINCKFLGNSVSQFLENFKKDKNEYFKLKIFTLFNEPDPEKYVNCYQETIDHFQLADDPITFAWVQYILGQIFTVLGKRELAAGFLQKSFYLYDSINIDDDEKVQCFCLYVEQQDNVSKKIGILNKIFKIYSDRNLFEGQRYAKLMEQYGDGIKEQTQFNIQQQILKQQEQDEPIDIKSSQQQNLNREKSSSGTNNLGTEIDYDTIYDFYQVAFDIYEQSLGKNNPNCLKLKEKICNTVKYFQDLNLYIQNMIEFQFSQKPDQQVDYNKINEFVQLVGDEDQLQNSIQYLVIDKAEYYEQNYNFELAQKYYELGILLLNSFNNGLIDLVKYRLEILRLKHMYLQTQKEFLVIEGYEKSEKIEDKNYFFKRWNINLIKNNDLKTALKSVDQNMVNSEENIVDFCEFLILRSAIFKQMEKYDKAEQNILKVSELVEQQDIFYLQQFVKDQLMYIQFLSQQQLDNKLDYNRKKFQKLLKNKSCQEQEILRLQMNCAYIHEIKNEFKASRDITKSVYIQSKDMGHKQVTRTASTTMNRLYEKKLMSQLAKQQSNQRPSTAF